MTRRNLGDPGSPEYFGQEAWLNELSVQLVADGTKKVLPTASLDADGKLVKTPDVVTRGGLNHQLIMDQNIVDKLSEIVTQLKLANMYQAVITGETFKPGDIEE